MLSSCKSKPLAPDEMRDAAGNRYKTVTVGSQVWMAENLKALYINCVNNSSVINSIDADFRYPDNNPAKHAIYGLLYTLDGASELVPSKGKWRIPTLFDFEKLLNELGVDYENGSSAVRNALNIDIFPGSNESDIISIDKYFSLLLYEYSSDLYLDYQTVLLFARDYPVNDYYSRTIYNENISKGYACSVRFVRDIE